MTSRDAGRMLALLLAAAGSAAGSDWGACEPTPVVAEELARIPTRQAEGQDYATFLQETTPALEKLAARFPRDVFVQRRAAPRIGQQAVDGLSSDPLALYIAGLSADDNDEAERLLKRAIEAAPDFPWPSEALARRFRRSARRRGTAVEHPQRLIELCPQRLEGFQLLAMAGGEGEDANKAAARYRALVAELPIGERASHYRWLWEWESNLAADGGAYRRRLAAELAALEGALELRGSDWLSTLRYGYRITDDLTAIERLNAELGRVRAASPQPPIFAYHQELAKFTRIRGAEQMAAASEARQAYWRALFEATDEWIEQWPLREFAWRDRLRALVELDDVDPAVVEMTGQGALRAAEQPDDVLYGRSTHLRAAAAYVKHGVRLEEAKRLALESLDSRSPYERIEAAELLADLAADGGDREGELGRLARTIGEKPSAADREGLLLWAGAMRDLNLRRAEMADDRQSRWEAYQAALDVRPMHEGRDANPQNTAAVGRVRSAWLSAGRAESGWAAWLADRPGVMIPSPRKASIAWREVDLPIPWEDDQVGEVGIVLIWTPNEREAGAVRELAAMAALEPGVGFEIRSTERNRLILENAVVRLALPVPVEQVRSAAVAAVVQGRPQSQLWLTRGGTIRRAANLDPRGERWAEMVLGAARGLRE